MILLSRHRSGRFGTGGRYGSSGLVQIAHDAVTLHPQKIEGDDFTGYANYTAFADSMDARFDNALGVESDGSFDNTVQFNGRHSLKVSHTALGLNWNKAITPAPSLWGRSIWRKNSPHPASCFVFDTGLLFDKAPNADVGSYYPAFWIEPVAGGYFPGIISPDFSDEDGTTMASVDDQWNDVIVHAVHNASGETPRYSIWLNGNLLWDNVETGEAAITGQAGIGSISFYSSWGGDTPSDTAVYFGLFEYVATSGVPYTGLEGVS